MSKEKVRKTVYMSEDMYAKVQAEADREFTSMNSIVLKAISIFLEKLTTNELTK